MSTFEHSLVEHVGYPPLTGDWIEPETKPGTSFPHTPHCLSDARQAPLGSQ